MTGLWVAIIGSVIFVGLGFFVFFWAKGIQKFFVEYYEKHPVLLSMDYFYEHIRGSCYLWELRIIGFVTFWLGVYLAHGTIRFLLQ